MTDYNKLKVAELKDMLKARGISASGLKKQQIIDSLEEDDASAGAGADESEQEEETQPKTRSKAGNKRKATSPVPAAPAPAAPAPAKQAKQSKKAKTEAAQPAAPDTAAADDGPKIADGQFVKAGAKLHIPVDEGFGQAYSYRVYVDEDSGIIYDASLNQTNASNNNNKFYRLQLLETGSGKNKSYTAWTRWGRVGENGQSAKLGNGSFQDAMKHFDKKFKDKSGLKWEDRGEKPKSGKYVFVEKSYEDETAPQNGAGSKDDADDDDYTAPVCTLEPSVQSLMELIFNEKHFAATMQNLNYDATKLPLGKLSKATITRGFAFLKDLAALMADPTANGSDFEYLSNQYYSYIPHAFGRQRPPVIRTIDMLKPEIELLESLTDLKDADEILKKAKETVQSIHPLDSRFQGLGMQEMSALPHSSTEFSEISQYLSNTCGSTHHVKYEVQDVFRIERQGEFDRFDTSKYAGIPSDRRLLWHGSRTTNFGGILSQGLRIAPPEAPVNGYMFDKGIYLADMSSKSANYCSAYDSDGHALLLLCEAELGDPMQVLQGAKYNAGETAKEMGAYSTWGQGKTAPKAWKDAGCIHPSLAGTKMPDTTDDPGDTNLPNTYLQYNEYICYDVAQVRLRYLLRVKM